RSLQAIDASIRCLTEIAARWVIPAAADARTRAAPCPGPGADRLVHATARRATSGGASSRAGRTRRAPGRELSGTHVDPHALLVGSNCRLVRGPSFVFTYRHRGSRLVVRRDAYGAQASCQQKAERRQQPAEERCHKSSSFLAEAPRHFPRAIHLPKVE